MTEPSHAIRLLPDASCDYAPTSASDRQFGRLFLFNDTQLVTYRGTRLCVVDPGLGRFVGYHGNLGYIVSVAACGSEIFVLRRVDSGRRIIRLGFAPELTNGMFLCLITICLNNRVHTHNPGEPEKYCNLIIRMPGLVYSGIWWRFSTMFIFAMPLNYC